MPLKNVHILEKIKPLFFIEIIKSIELKTKSKNKDKKLYNPKTKIKVLGEKNSRQRLKYHLQKQRLEFCILNQILKF